MARSTAMKPLYVRLVYGLAGFCAFAPGCIAGMDMSQFDIEQRKCNNDHQVRLGSSNHVSASQSIVKPLSSQFFGFNLEWVGFQDDLWDSLQGKVRKEIIDAMAFFPEAVYRFPGGTVANHYEVNKGIGRQLDRPKQRPVDWKPAFVNEFGLSEYAAFVSAVQGTPWVVGNIYGDDKAEMPDEFVKAQANDWALAVNQFNSQPYRWELGNELDRGKTGWRPEKLSNRARLFAETLSGGIAFVPGFVVPLADYNAREDMDARSYNEILADTLKGIASEFAHHLYYDGPPGGPPIPHRLRQICQSQAAIISATGIEPGFWITEHARWPEGPINTPAWKSNWHQTQNMEAALSVADMTIALSQMPSVKGAFLHSLAGTYGPWPLFHKVEGKLEPSVIYWALRILRDSMLDEVLTTRTTSTKKSSYAGGYDIRASVMSNKDRTIYSIWAVNHHAEATSIRFELTGLETGTVGLEHTFLSDVNPLANNREDGRRVRPKTNLSTTEYRKDGGVELFIPPYSINAFIINFDNEYEAPLPPILRHQ